MRVLISSEQLLILAWLNIHKLFEIFKKEPFVGVGFNAYWYAAGSWLCCRRPLFKTTPALVKLNSFLFFGNHRDCWDNFLSLVLIYFYKKKRFGKKMYSISLVSGLCTCVIWEHLVLSIYDTFQYMISFGINGLVPHPLILLSSLIRNLSHLSYTPVLFSLGEAKPHRTTRLVLLRLALLSTFAFCATRYGWWFWLCSMFLGSFRRYYIFIVWNMVYGWLPITDGLCLVVAIIEFFGKSRKIPW